jgi:natural product biosynthesis luciferase-like monooxygenase protein
MLAFGRPPQRQRGTAVELSLFYFADNRAGHADRAGRERYRLLMDGARFADTHGFAAVWTPERHFHPFGGLYPNPAVTGAAVAAVTERVGVRAGSVVLPLHDPVRVAEEWSVVDNLSGGRVGVSFASGWHAVDFALSPGGFADRRQRMLAGIETVQALWRGEAVARRDGVGEPVTVRLFPPPVQPRLPVWITSSKSVETCRQAGTLGASLLTHLLGQSVDELAGKIAAYRQALRERHGADRRGHVTLMLHTFLDEDVEAARAAVRAPFSAYLRSSFDLVLSWARSIDETFEPERLAEGEVEFLVDRAFERYFVTSGLFGTVETGTRMLRRLAAIGVDEVACLIDFGLDDETVLAGLERLDALRKVAAAEGAETAGETLPAGG